MRYRDLKRPAFTSRAAHSLKQLARALDPRREPKKRDDNDPWQRDNPAA